MAAALAVNEPRRDLIGLRVEQQSIASQPGAEPEVGPAYFFRPAEPLGVNFSQTKNSALSSFFPERGWSSLFHNVIQNLIRSPSTPPDRPANRLSSCAERSASLVRDAAPWKPHDWNPCQRVSLKKIRSSIRVHGLQPHRPVKYRAQDFSS